MVAQGNRHRLKLIVSQTFGDYFDNEHTNLWNMQNGYCFPTIDGLAEVERQLSDCSDAERDGIRGRLRVGVQKQTEVTIGSANHRITQVFCSALPITYSDVPIHKWNRFPQLILAATYEATFHIALQNLCDTGCRTLYLTLVGGGVFGNRLEWILAAIDRSLRLFASTDLVVYIVSYQASNPKVADFVATQNST